MSKRSARGDLIVEGDPVEIIPLGAGQEVGRSCILLRYRGKTVMFDCGLHPGRAGQESLPKFDWEAFDIADVDTMLVTHFHNDHCAAVPFVVGRTNFRGRIFMTHPTKAIYHHVLRDSVQVSKRSGTGEEALFSEDDLERSLKRIELIDFHQTVDVNGIKVTAYMAGHVLGAAMFLVEIDGLRVLYTGDYSRHPDRHMPGAEIPDQPPHVVIVESTYGVAAHLPRAEREKRFLDKVVECVTKKKGRVLLPVVALGRAQELLMLMEQYWDRNQDKMRDIPVYQISSMAAQAMPVYQSYIEMMNEDIRRAFKLRNPFIFRHIRMLDRSNQLDEMQGPCVVLATPSTMMSGTSRELFERWCEDERNALIIADFAVQGTLAREVLSNPKSIASREGRQLPLRMAVEAISFSAHADFPQTAEFLDILHPPHVVLVHGEKTGMEKLGKELESRAQMVGIPRTVHMPANLEAVSFRHRAERTAKVVGRLAEKGATENRYLKGVLVRRGAEDLVVAPEDLGTYTRLTTCAVRHRQLVPVDHRSFSDIRLALEATFEGVASVRSRIEAADASGVSDTGGDAVADSDAGGAAPGPSTSAVSSHVDSVRIGELVTVTYKPGSAGGAASPSSDPGPHLILEWEGGTLADMLADGVVAVVLQQVGEPRALVAAEKARRSALDSSDLHAACLAELRIVAEMLQAQFGPVQVDEASLTLVLQSDGRVATVDHREQRVSSEDEGLRERVKRAVRRVQDAMTPLALTED